MGNSLRELEIVVVDCQTTGATPDHGHLIELAWALTSADSPLQRDSITCFPLRLPAGATISRRITSLTGITEEMLYGAIHPDEAWWLLAASLSSFSGDAVTPVAHFARFEETWLRGLSGNAGFNRAFPEGMICTREIALRLYPGLPRKGLHALSGFLGRTVPELRRAVSHVEATAFVWQRMVDELDSRGISSFANLREWLDEPPPSGKRQRTYVLPREKRLGLPDCPGVYRFLGRDGKILYIGKAASLRRRVNSYFTKHKADGKTLELVTQVHDLSTTLCGSPLEASVLECRLIREHKPPYNRAMRSGDEKLWFRSSDMLEWSNLPTGNCPVGPFVSRGAHDRLRELMGLISGRTRFDESRMLSLFQLEHFVMEADALREGLSLLEQDFKREGRIPAFNEMLRFGRDLWLDRILRKEEEEPEDTVDEAPQSDEPIVLDAENLCSILKWSVAETALQERRLRWFRLMAWSTIGWTRSAPEPDRMRYVVVRNGGIALSEDCSVDDGPPADPLPLPLQRRIPVLNRTGYETLRVLTSEIRRISCSDGHAVVLLPTGRLLQGEALARLLEMV